VETFTPPTNTEGFVIAVLVDGHNVESPVHDRFATWQQCAETATAINGSGTGNVLAVCISVADRIDTCVRYTKSGSIPDCAWLTKL
jgi:hypothetical protein